MPSAPAFASAAAASFIALFPVNLLGAVVMGALVATHGWQGLLAQMGWFFTKAALAWKLLS